jgi:hypothetical protein
MTRMLAVVLIVLGLVGIAYGGITYVSDRHSVELGEMELAVEERNTIPIPPIAGAVAVAAGVALLALRRRSASTT